MYEELLWPGTSPKPGKNRSGRSNLNYLLGGRVGGWVANHFTFVPSSRVMGQNRCKFFHTDILIILRILITNAKGETN